MQHHDDVKSVKSGRDGRTRIIEGALRRFSQDGVSATTLASLREESGVSVGSFYHHFASKEHVFGVLYTEILESYQERFVAELVSHQEARDGIEAVVAFHMRWAGEHPERARLLISERPPRKQEPGGAEVAQARHGFFRQVSDWWKPHMKNGVLQPVHADHVLRAVARPGAGDVPPVVRRGARPDRGRDQGPGRGGLAEPARDLRLDLPMPAWTT